MRVLCWLVSMFSLVLWGLARTLHPGNMNFPHNYFLLKYAGDIALLNFAILMFIYPSLINKGYISTNYHGDNISGKSKSIFVTYSIMLPGMILLCTAGILAKFAPFFIIAILFCYFYLKNCYFYIFKGKSSLVS